ncbi:Cro/CI family transcriptional regulator [Enterobacter hormaechei]|uniref:Cro/CI family transcriptional regulator n=1 Tax=Pantoea sp. JZ2 TaxID=2654189 RepID=UPI002B480024|nr:Cro/CI family transcriptional regulator [Pantoea sp. JZ2]WRH13762.1 transcriptional regulator [Pantoea sp. JZ2]
MLTTDAIKFFRTKTKLAKAAGVSQAAVSRWVRAGFIPQGSAAILSSASLGALNFDRGFYQRLKVERMEKRKTKREKELNHENQSSD